jgi:hypothetical protein
MSTICHASFCWFLFDACTSRVIGRRIRAGFIDACDTCAVPYGVIRR